MFKINTFDGGTNGAELVAGSSGGASGDAFNAAETGMFYRNLPAFQGGMSLQMPVSTDGIMRWSLDGERAFATRDYFFITDAKTGDFLCGNLEVTGPVTSFSKLINGANQLRVRAAGTNVWTAAASFPLSQWVRVETLGNIGTTASNGALRIAYYLGNSEVPIQDSGTLTGLDLSGDHGTLTNARFGKIGATTGSDYIDAIAVATGADAVTFIGPYSIPLAQPIPIVASRAKPSSPGASDGTTTLSWSAIPDADHYEVSLVNGTISDPAAYAAVPPTVLGSPTGTTFTATGLSAGTRTFGVRAMPEA